MEGFVSDCEWIIPPKDNTIAIAIDNERVNKVCDFVGKRAIEFAKCVIMYGNDIQNGKNGFENRMLDSLKSLNAKADYSKVENALRKGAMDLVELRDSLITFSTVITEMLLQIKSEAEIDGEYEVFRMQNY